MPRTRPLILVSAFSLMALFIVLLVVELAPIVAVATTDGLWFMAVPEEFTATLWSPLRPLLWGSYFYHYFGFFYYTAIRPAHWLTEWLLGSREVTIAYTQVYGTIIRSPSRRRLLHWPQGYSHRARFPLAPRRRSCCSCWPCLSRMLTFTGLSREGHLRPLSKAIRYRPADYNACMCRAGTRRSRVRRRADRSSWRDRRDTVLRKPSIFRACDLSNAADRRDDTRAADPG
jgi:hypothetical protein